MVGLRRRAAALGRAGRSLLPRPGLPVQRSAGAILRAPRVLVELHPLAERRVRRAVRRAQQDDRP